jgi:hypothetical protein
MSCRAICGNSSPISMALTVQRRTVKETGSPLDFTPDQIGLID